MTQHSTSVECCVFFLMPSIIQTIKSFLLKYSLLDKPVFAGFSGGADSTALLLALHQAGAQVTAVHFNHGIRGDEADEDAQWCQDFCKTRNIPFLSQLLHVPQNTARGESCEEAARRLRIEAWLIIAGNKAPVFLAHHADDALETLFLRLARGSNVSAIVPLKTKRTIAGVTFFRPMLNIRRQEIEDWLTSQNITDWRIDSTNSDNAYRRNAVRNKLLPLFRNIFTEDSGLIHALDVLGQDADFLDSAALDAFHALKNLKSWQALKPAILPRVFRLWLSEQGHPNTQITHQFILRLQDALSNFNGHQLSIPLDSSFTVVISQSGMATDTPAAWMDTMWNWKTQPVIELPCAKFFASDAPAANASAHEAFSTQDLPDSILIRHWQPGDKMIPFGSKSQKKLQDIFTDAKIPRFMRQHIPIFVANNHIIWIPTVRRAEFGRVSNDSPYNSITFSMNGHILT